MIFKSCAILVADNNFSKFMSPAKKKVQRIQIAPHAGFCFGVKRAVEMAENVLEKNKSRVYSCGPLIHNPQVIEELKKKGFCVVESPEEVPAGSTFIIRSHGVTPELVEKIKKKKVKIIDATCPFVKKAHKIAEKFFLDGCQTVICGDPKHAEVIGINARTKNTALIFDNPVRAKKVQAGKKIGVLCQTTQKISLLKKVVENLLENNKSLSVENTICLDSSTKQAEAAALAKQVDVMIVIGGKNSSNTTKLAQISRLSGAKTFHIETAGELKKSWFRKNDAIGLTAGASTPQKAIEKVKKEIEKIIL